MASNEKSVKSVRKRKASTPEERENEMIALAVDLAEEQLRNGTASTQVISHYLKLATKRESLERDILEQRYELMSAQTEAIKSAQRVEELYSEALSAMRLYNGQVEKMDDYD